MAEYKRKETIFLLTVKVIDLWAVANLMKSDKMKYVTIDIVDEDDDSPASLSFSAVKSLEDFEEIDYDPVEAIPESPLL